DDRRTVMTVPAGITTGLGGGGGGAGRAATGAAGGFKSGEEFPSWAEGGSEPWACFVLSAAGADGGSDFLSQAVASESSATDNNVATFRRAIVILLTSFPLFHSSRKQ